MYGTLGLTSSHPHVALQFFGLGLYQSRLHVCLATYLSCDSIRLRVGSRYLPTYLPTYHLVRPTHIIIASRAALFLVSSSFWSSRVQTTLVLIFLLFFSSVKGLWIVVLPLQPRVVVVVASCFFHPCWCWCFFIDFSSF